MLRLNRPLLVAGLGASLLAGVATLPATAQNAPMQLAQAGPQGGGATMDVDLFYDQLGQFGTWVAHPEYQYVFIPSDVGPGWRPYQEGRWVWTDAYGWYWESFEPFGWATYHYGRWGYDPAYGWFWVPGDTWAPAWVTWRRGGGKTGWAPIAPDRPGYAVGRPDHYAAPVAESWVFVEDRYIAEENLAVHVAPIPEINVYLEAAPDIYEPSWDDGYYVNRGFGTDVYAAPIRERLVTREVYYVERRDDVFYDPRSSALGIFAPRLDFGDRRGPPPRYVREIEPDRRPLIRQYVREDRDVPGFLAPSVALLNLLQPDRRRELRDQRFGNPDRYRREVRDLQRDRADGLRDERRQAEARADAFQRAQREALEKRRQNFEKMQAEQRQRAERAQKARPAGFAPGGVPGRPGGPDARPAGPDARPGAPGTRSDARPGVTDQRPGGPDARPGTPGTRPGTPGQRPDAAGGTPARPGPSQGQAGDGPSTPRAPDKPRTGAEERQREQQEQQRAKQQQNQQERQQNQNAQQEQQRAKQQQNQQERQQKQNAQQEQQRAKQQQNQQERQQKQNAQQEQQRAKQQQNQQNRQQKQNAQQEQQRAKQQQNQQNRQQKQNAQQEQQRAKQQQRQEQVQQRQQKPQQAPGQPRPPGGGKSGGQPPGQPPVPPGAQ
ncbi:hypothetical protein EV667_2765 [Ancylobacter aquaticus]|uniref:Uncharacterized protein n=1 Tax=Ancylobacter aquaticus TaxID=100 RepID=A0A4R1IDH5_ANCAQ|nr:DUF6600 domain-containing protein [Ancylobacter aquaticus]TCK28752.1 hypothetical protein EV667_2765 [Ancylobacter aquaticus]